MQKDEKQMNTKYFCNGTAATTNCITFTIEKRAAKLTSPLALKTNATSGNFNIYLFQERLQAFPVGYFMAFTRI